MFEGEARVAEAGLQLRILQLSMLEWQVSQVYDLSGTYFFWFSFKKCLEVLAMKQKTCFSKFLKNSERARR